MCECKCGDQVPGRTITESEFSWRTSLCSELETHWFKVGYLAAGGAIVQDPEPSNAELLADALKRTNPAHGSDLHDIKGLSEALDKAGVKAPGGDDDH